MKDIIIKNQERTKWVHFTLDFLFHIL
jgi:hypothetical protein